jgi:hypothetical protein
LRHVLRAIGVALISLFSIPALIGIVDWVGRWEWFKGVMLEHPQIAGFVRTPWLYVPCVILGFFILWWERKLELPRVRVKLTNAKVVPRIWKVKAVDVFAEQRRDPGWDDRQYPWDWLIEVYLVNESEIETTIQAIEGKLTYRWRRIPVEFIEDLTDYIMFDKDGHDPFKDTNSDRPLPNLVETLKNLPLKHGIGHRGWVRFGVKNASHKEMKRSRLNMWLIDSFDQRHKFSHRKSREKKWDKNIEVAMNVDKPH